MTGNAPLAATITVKQVYDNGPGKPSKVIDDSGHEWKFWTESKYGRAIPADTFSTGAKVVVAYKVGQFNGKEDRTITSVIDGQTTRPTQAASKAPAKHFRNSMDPEDARHANASLLVAAAVKAGQVNIFESKEISDAYKSAYKGYDDAHKPTHIQKAEIDFDDEIPFGRDRV